MSVRVELPYNWEPRDYQMGAWEYLQNGGRLAELIWHRRSGKDELSLHWTMIAAFQRVANYWHMLPEYAQARKAIWGAINPHTGKRRIDEAFPMELRETTREHEMQIVFKNGSSWQLVGSDRYNGLVGSPPAGVVYSEWALTNPAARGFIRPIMAENNGWQIFITTPRSRNHAHRTFIAAQQNPKAYAELLTVRDTGILSEERLQEERQGYIDTFGADEGEALFEQEYFCSFDAAILGSFYGKEIRRLEEAGRILPIEYDLFAPVHTAWDLGYRDDTAIWWYQVIAGEIHVIDFHAVSGATIAELAEVIGSKPYRYGKHHLPHDARAKTLASGGKSIIEQLAAHLGINSLVIVPDIGVQDGIQAVRRMMPRVWFDETRCADGIEALRQYQREYDEDKKAFRQTPRHDWCFTGDTEILTRYGTHQIMNLPYSGEVLTSCGWKRYINPRVTRKNASLVEVRFVGGYSVKCTPDHLFKTANGWVCSEFLVKGTQIQSALTRSPSILTAAYTAFGRAKNTCLAAAKSFTETCGALLLGRSQMDAIFTTGTTTQRTTELITWSASQQRSICLKHGINTRARGLVNQLETLPQAGTSQTRGGCGTSDTLNERKAGQNGSASQSPAHNATKSSWRSFAKAATLKSIAALFAKLRLTGIAVAAPQRALVIESVRKLKTKDDVWCLTVPEASEFALANGAIVHNCSHPADAFRMLAVAWQAEPVVNVPASERPLMVGPQNEVSLNDMWAAHDHGSHRSRARI